MEMSKNSLLTISRTAKTRTRTRTTRTKRPSFPSWKAMESLEHRAEPSLTVSFRGLTGPLTGGLRTFRVWEQGGHMLCAKVSVVSLRG